jgi:hypothetical protein
VRFMARLKADSSVVARALEFLVLTAARTGEVLRAKWGEVRRSALDKQQIGVGKKSIKLHVSGPVAARDFHAVSVFSYRGTASACCHRPIVSLRSRAKNLPAFFQIGHRRRFSFTPSIRHADFCRRNCKYFSRT